MVLFKVYLYFIWVLFYSILDQTVNSAGQGGFEFFNFRLHFFQLVTPDKV